MVTINRMTYQICTRCVMDTSDPDIVFDEQGVCSHCHVRDTALGQAIKDPAERERVLLEFVERIKTAGRGKPYDCVIGVSGGVDSTYVAYKVKELGLRPLAVHLDNGWDSELAVHNIQKVLQKLNIDLDTQVLDWDEFRDIQLAFLRASTPDSEIPTDHAIFACVFQAAWKRNIPYIVLGLNHATETTLPRRWSQGHFDWRYIQAVHQQFGTRSIKTFPHFDLIDYIRYIWWSRKRSFVLLDYLDYQKSEAMDLLQNVLGWESYGGKHYESIYTRFFQGYILPTKFGYDKRRAHLSDLVGSGQLSREDALQQLAEDPYPSEALKQQDKDYVTKKLGLTADEFEEIMRLPPRAREEFPYIDRAILYRGVRGVYKTFRRMAQVSRSRRSDA